MALRFRLFPAFAAIAIFAVALSILLGGSRQALIIIVLRLAAAACYFLLNSLMKPIKALTAADAMDGNGVLTLETGVARSGGSVEISVSKTGCGIPPEDIDRIFDPFFTTKEVGRGTGLGLSVSYGIIRAHDGDISVSSTPGAGNRFTVTLPGARESA
jgi:signal transduction histidine kinase